MAAHLICKEDDVNDIHNKIDLFLFIAYLIFLARINVVAASSGELSYVESEHY